MGVKGIGLNRTKIERRDRLMMIGGTTLIAALLVVGVLMVFLGDDVARAREDMRAIRPNQEAEIAFGSVVLLGPRRSISKGTRLQSGLLRDIHWPRDQVPEGAIRNPSDIDGMFANIDLPAGQPILRSNISPNPPSYGIGQRLPEGHRAVTIQVDAISGVEGWATPGAHVDLYLTHLDPEAGVYKTIVAVEDAIVLSYGGEAQTKNSKFDMDRTKVKSTVTLAVSFEDSLKIQTAKAMGTITLALRNSNDTTSQGIGVFRGDEWLSQGNKQSSKQSRTIQERGYVRFHNDDGFEETVVLGKDDKLYRDNAYD